MPQWLVDTWPHLSTALAFLLALVAAAHAVLFKRDVRGSIGWIAVIFLVPLVGAVLYVLLGVNRIRRKAVALRGELRRFPVSTPVPLLTAHELRSSLDGHVQHLADQARLVDRVTGRPLLAGNSVQPLVDGDEAYPTMLAAIESAESSISLASYIFDSDAVGQRFVNALVRARSRGVEVRVLIDDAGARYSRPPVDRYLRRGRVRVARFLPAWRPWLTPYLNLRNHRKVLIVDGSVAFTGGINIRQGHMLSGRPKHPIRDLHFRVAGPLTAQLQDVFAEDWEFSTGEVLEGERWFPELHAAGDVPARIIADGPDQDFEKMRWTLLGAIATARQSVRVMTPYFLPDQSLTTALDVAAMRGVSVDIVLPEKGNLIVVQWAMWAHLWQQLGRGCRVWLTPPPFDHSKAMVVDDHWVLFGSANWDPRSLRLNFELDVECYHAPLAEHLAALIDSRIASARELDHETLAARGLAVRLRDGVARLLTPYL